jgi:hypothetical protein
MWSRVRKRYGAGRPSQSRRAPGRPAPAASSPACWSNWFSAIQAQRNDHSAAGCVGTRTSANRASSRRTCSRMHEKSLVSASISPAMVGSPSRWLFQTQFRPSGRGQRLLRRATHVVNPGRSVAALTVGRAAMHEFPSVRWRGLINEAAVDPHLVAPDAAGRRVRVPREAACRCQGVPLSGRAAPRPGSERPSGISSAATAARNRRVR